MNGEVLFTRNKAYVVNVLIYSCSLSKTIIIGRLGRERVSVQCTRFMQLSIPLCLVNFALWAHIKLTSKIGLRYLCPDG